MMAAHSEPESKTRAGGDLAIGTLPNTPDRTTRGRRMGTSERTTEKRRARRQKDQRCRGGYMSKSDDQRARKAPSEETRRPTHTTTSHHVARGETRHGRTR